MPKNMVNFKRNAPALYEKYLTLPRLADGDTARCPTRNMDGSEIEEGQTKGCGSANVSWDGDVYDCHDCGIFFSDYAADPPHRRDD